MEKIQSGQPMRIKADTFNSILDATRAYKERQQGGGRSANREYSDSNIVLVKNDSGVDAERFGVLGIDGPIIPPSENLSEFENRVTFACSTPTAGTHEGKFVVLAGPIAAGAIGRALALGVTPVQVNVTNETHTHAVISDAHSDYLASATNGSSQILWKESGTGTKWALIRLGINRRPTQLFAVKVWRDGGATDGDLTNQCDRTYKARTIDATAHDADGILLGIELTPAKHRANPGKYTTPPEDGAGTIGLGYYDTTNTFVLWDANEVEFVGGCDA